jgi:hypothetical protein
LYELLLLLLLRCGGILGLELTVVRRVAVWARLGRRIVVRLFSCVCQTAH